MTLATCDLLPGRFAAASTSGRGEREQWGAAPACPRVFSLPRRRVAALRSRSPLTVAAAGNGGEGRWDPTTPPVPPNTFCTPPRTRLIPPPPPSLPPSAQPWSEQAQLPEPPPIISSAVRAAAARDVDRYMDWPPVSRCVRDALTVVGLALLIMLGTFVVDRCVLPLLRVLACLSETFFFFCT